MKNILILALLISPVVIWHFIIRAIQRRADDDLIDKLIDANRFKPRDGMATIDWSTTNRVGGRVWATALRGQRRYTAQAPPKE